MNLVPVDETFGDWDALLALILTSFAYMQPRIDPPSSASAPDASIADRKGEGGKGLCGR